VPIDRNCIANSQEKYFARGADRIAKELIDQVRREHPELRGRAAWLVELELAGVEREIALMIEAELFDAFEYGQREGRFAAEDDLL
jgi:hypothetical protein